MDYGFNTSFARGNLFTQDKVHILHVAVAAYINLGNLSIV